MNKAELEEKIEELQEKLDEKQQTIDELKESNSELKTEVQDLEDVSINLEEYAKKCFDAGNPENWQGKTAMQSWLNFKVLELSL